MEAVDTFSIRTTVKTIEKEISLLQWETNSNYAPLFQVFETYLIFLDKIKRI